MIRGVSQAAILATVFATTLSAGDKPTPLSAPRSRDAAVAAVVAHQAAVAAEDRPFVRFFWFGALDTLPPERAEEVLSLWRVYLHTVSTAAPTLRPQIGRAHV